MLFLADGGIVVLRPQRWDERMRDREQRKDVVTCHGNIKMEKFRNRRLQQKPRMPSDKGPAQEFGRGDITFWLSRGLCTALATSLSLSPFPLSPVQNQGHNT